MARDAHAGPRPAMPPFLRTAWVSEDARGLWAPRLQAVRSALEELALQRALAGGGAFAVRPASLETLRRTAAAQGRALQVLADPAAAPFDTAFGRAGRRWLGVEGDSAPAAERCGCAACAAVQAAAGAEDDPVWALALGASGARPSPDAPPLEIAADGVANPLLAPLGIAAAPGWPLAVDCPERARLADLMQAEGERAGHGEAMAWLRHMLAWPMSWSALHGIVEVKTPVVRYVRDTSYSAQLMSARWLGEATPARAAQGLGFPFRHPRSLQQADHD